MTSCVSSHNLSDALRSHAIFHSDLSVQQTRRIKFPNCIEVFRCDLSRVVRLAVGHDGFQDISRVGRVLARRNVFKVVEAVVQFVTVFVVYPTLFLRRWRSDKSEHYDLMDRHTEYPATFTKHEAVVATDVDLRLSEARLGPAGGSNQSSDAPVCRDFVRTFKVGDCLPDFNVFHEPKYSTFWFLTQLGTA